MSRRGRKERENAPPPIPSLALRLLLRRQRQPSHQLPPPQMFNLHTPKYLEKGVKELAVRERMSVDAIAAVIAPGLVRINPILVVCVWQLHSPATRRGLGERMT